MRIVFMLFERIRVDLVRPLTPSMGRHPFILVVIDYTTQYPEAIPLYTALALAVAQELATLFTRVGFSKQVVPDQGMVFMGKSMKALAQMVGLQTLYTMVYHPQTNGLVEHFNGTDDPKVHN